MDHCPPYWTATPFLFLLLAIALFPLVPGISRWWKSNLHRAWIVLPLAGVTVVYYLFFHLDPLVAGWPVPHVTAPSPGGPNFAQARDVLAGAILGEYAPFIILLFSLYTITGGVRLEAHVAARPATNAFWLAVGGILASFIGTTGAAMLLVRPLLAVNRKRRHVAHTAVFFIFIVCNCGGCLLPVGDPPLLLGYLLGVPFLWPLRLWPQWLMVNGLLLTIYYLLDRFWYPRERLEDVAAAPLSPCGRGGGGEGKSRSEREVPVARCLRLLGFWPHGPLLLLVIAAVATLDPISPVPGTTWHAWIYLREAVLLGLAAVSLVLGGQAIRRANHFNYDAMIEVAVLFLGIFVCMQPLLEILAARGPQLGLATPTQFFWASGGLSSVLDNAPTYVVFFQTARTLTPAGTGLPPDPLLVAISLGSVFMGAMTYIGNGPNFMVKSIAEHFGVPMPGFFRYMLYSGLILLPLLVLTNWIFLR
ncbi:MAG: sodium:proton antiporter [Thermoguttaceae bacterium]|jgi:Na+/H+ antiporter NhaD/arsenite permease-like protein